MTPRMRDNEKRGQGTSTAQKPTRRATKKVQKGETSKSVPSKDGQSGNKRNHWKAMPGWLEDKVLEVLKANEDVDGKQVKASKDDPRIVLKSNSSGKTCVRQADNVYFD
ncbi:hypothetical protein RBB50_000858 [Rhinocladiella similis]